MNFSANYLWRGCKPDQSESIRFGNYVENEYLSSFILKAGGILVSKQTCKELENLSGHQIDKLFWFNSSLYYKESKTNINLDSEKMPETIRKMEDICQTLIKEYPGVEVCAKLLNVAWLDSGYKNNYPIEGFNDFRKGLGLSKWSEEEHVEEGRRVNKQFQSFTQSDIKSKIIKKNKLIGGFNPFQK